MSNCQMEGHSFSRSAQAPGVMAEYWAADVVWSMEASSALTMLHS